jgi:predicted TIM-barrel fold metal-dependent hydrolase
MIVDVHAHCWPDGSFTEEFIADARRMRASAVDLLTPYDRYVENLPPGEEVTTIVFGGKARLSGIWVNDADVADFVAQAPDRMIGFLSVDPTQPGWEEELVEGHEGLGLRGVKLLPMYADFYPQDERLDPLWRYATRHQLPVLLHTGTTFVSKAPIDCTLPRHLDVVARRYPEVTMILAHLGHPYESETVAVIRKHPRLFADVSALVYRPWQLFHSLMAVHEYNVWDKLLLGTDYPVTTVQETVSGLRKLTSVQLSGFSLPAEQIERLIYRDSLTLLGLSGFRAARPAQKVTT